MLIMDLYALLPAFTLACFLGILLWPENIAYITRLRLFIIILTNWVVASFLQLIGYGTDERRLVYIINLMVGFFGLILLVVTYRTKPLRDEDQNSK